MLAGELYDASDGELRSARRRARDLCQMLNRLGDAEEVERARLLEELFGAVTDVFVQAPFFCDYGRHIHLGEKVYFNFNCVVLDVAEVSIGHRTLFGPTVQIYTALHPWSARERKTGLEFARPVVIEEDVWVGGGAIVCPGVTIGAGTVIGAGSVVTRDIPKGVFAAGNPCRVIRTLADEVDRQSVMEPRTTLHSNIERASDSRAT